MIKSYRTRQSARFAGGERVREFDQIAKQAQRRLVLLNAANSLSALASVPGNRLEALRGDRAGQHSIRINDQWRICFVWNEAERSAEFVEIVDYH
jgi:proteic killer suppression protein